MSGTAESFDLFLRAAAAKIGRITQVRTLPFNTLGQLLRQEASAGEAEVFLLFPWDFAPETDWRSGVPAGEIDKAELRARAEAVARLLSARRCARFLYVPASAPPVFADATSNVELSNHLLGLAACLGARILPATTFALGSYLANGCPVGGGSLGEVAEAIVQQVHTAAPEPCKVLVTDLDHSLWCGVVAEDGLDGIHFAPEGRGFRHFIYQSLLAKLERAGVLLAAVSRNDAAVGLEPLRSRRMLLREEDFVCVLCSYHAKSAQIRNIAEQLNLSLDSFVFVDDNPVELAEVSRALPQVHCLQFPSHDDGLVALFSELSRLFTRAVVTAEDHERSEMYRRRLAGMPPAELESGDVTEFLRALRMSLTLHDRSSGPRDRLVQLINKTNQFNLNGEQVSEEQVSAALRSGARLYGAALSDQHGSHGEILACLVSAEGTIRQFVMSCRVFQRRVEYAFLSWLCAQPSAPHALAFQPTPRNEPFRKFLNDPAFEMNGSMVRLDAARFAAAHAEDLDLFALKGPELD
jgi:FkbH-like protein